LFPMPALSARFPYAEGKSYKSEQALGAVRTIECGRIPEAAPGEGMADALKRQKPVTRFLAPDAAPAITEPTDLFVAYDSLNLYLGVRCRDSKVDSIAAPAKKRDDAVYAEDCVGFFLQPDMAKGIVYQFYFSSRGVIFDQKITAEKPWQYDQDRSWDGEIKVVPFKDTNSWGLHAVVSLAQFGLKPRSGMQMGFNFRRKQFRVKGIADWQVPLSGFPEALGVLKLK
jgi:hypothetical protein